MDLGYFFLGILKASFLNPWGVLRTSLVRTSVAYSGHPWTSLKNLFGVFVGLLVASLGHDFVDFWATLMHPYGVKLGHHWASLERSW